MEKSTVLHVNIPIAAADLRWKGGGKEWESEDVVYRGSKTGFILTR